jgi:hypothetical protein
MNAKQKAEKKIRLLFRLMRAPGTEAEAAAAAAAIARLAEAYRLDIAKIELEESPAAAIKQVRYDAADFTQMETLAPSQWLEMLVHSIAEANNCRILRHAGCAVYWFVGLETDIQVCIGTTNMLVNSIFRIFSRQASDITPDIDLDFTSFAFGFAETIAKKLRIAFKTRLASPFALIRLDREIEQAISSYPISEPIEAKEKLDFHSYMIGIAEGKKTDPAGKFIGGKK